jgi:hypothetical protein
VPAHSRREKIPAIVPDEEGAAERGAKAAAPPDAVEAEAQ